MVIQPAQQSLYASGSGRNGLKRAITLLLQPLVPVLPGELYISNGRTMEASL